MVERAAAPDTGNDARRQADRDGKDDGKEREFQGCWEEREELVENRLLCDDRNTEVAVQQSAHEDQVLFPDRLVEAELGHELSVPFRLDTALAGH